MYPEEIQEVEAEARGRISKVCFRQLEENNF